MIQIKEKCTLEQNGYSSFFLLCTRYNQCRFLRFDSLFDLVEEFI